MTDTTSSLRSLNFTLAEVSSVLGVSIRILQQRANEWNSTSTIIAEEALDHEIDQIKLNFPNSGEVMITGHLLSRGILLGRVPRFWKCSVSNFLMLDLSSYFFDSTFV